MNGSGAHPGGRQGIADAGLTAAAHLGLHGAYSPQPRSGPLFCILVVWLARMPPAAHEGVYR